MAAFLTSTLSSSEAIQDQSPSEPKPEATVKKAVKQSPVSEEKDRKDLKEVVSNPKNDNAPEAIIFLYGDKTFKTYKPAE